jgi:hypothetical protein
MKKRIVKYKRILLLGTEPPVVNELPEAGGVEEGGWMMSFNQKKNGSKRLHHNF